MECSSPTVIDLGEWGEDLLAKLGGKRYLFGCTFELTERCNLACVHCYINRPAASRAAAARELTCEQVCQIIAELAEAGCLYLTLTGGEVLLRPDFLEVYRHAKQLGMLVSIFTNGTLLTPAIADALAEYRPRAIELSIYGHSRETYERVTQTPGSHARFLEGVRLLVERRLPLSLKTVVLDLNRHELEEIRAFARQLGVQFRHDAVLWPRLDSPAVPVTHALGVDEVVALDVAEPERVNEWRNLVQRFGLQALRAERVFACGAGVRTCHVSAVGHLSACMMAREPAYNLLSGSFREGWDRVLGPAVGARRVQQTACRTCTLGVVCGQCPGWSQRVHGDSETPVEYNCRLAHLRATAMNLMQCAITGDNA